MDLSNDSRASPVRIREVVCSMASEAEETVVGIELKTASIESGGANNAEWHANASNERQIS